MDNRTIQEVERDYAITTAAHTENIYKLFSMLKPEIRRDENVWEVFYGENLMDGVCGYGDTPHLAVIDWNKSWEKEATAKITRENLGEQASALAMKHLKAAGMMD